MSDLKIGHVPCTAMMYDIFDCHMLNLSNLESMYGFSTQILPSVSYFSFDMISDLDIIHIHGIPHIDESIQFLTFIKNLYLMNKKFVISVYNYSLLCERFILQNEDRFECTNCSNEKCLKIKELYDFIKDIDLFVYSENIKNRLIQNGYKNVYKLPICQYWDSTDFVFKTNEYDLNSCGYFEYPELFEKENNSIKEIKNENKYNYKQLNYYDKINTGKVLLNYQWDCPFPYDISYCLSNGNTIIINDYIKFDEYSIINKYINYIQDGSYLYNLINKEISIDNLKLISYEYWKNFGPHYCISYYDSYYRKIIWN